MMAAAEVYSGQAMGLRRLSAPEPVRVVAVTGGKGGVGKTNVSVNLSIALSKMGRRVLLMDTDLGLGNADVLLGLRPKLNLSHVLNGEATLEEVVVQTPGGVSLLPASSGGRGMADVVSGSHAGLIRAFSEFVHGLDVLVIDTAAGISAGVLAYSKASQEIIVVVCDEPASITDAYALIKTLHRDHGCHRFRILGSMVQSAAEGRDLFMKLVRVTDQFLDVTLDYMGFVPYDDFVRCSIRRQRAVVDAYPRSKAALAFRKIAAVTDNWSIPSEASGQVEFFVERLIGYGNRGAEVHV